jgi:23S rRNA maturation-related 3'-5' exoribonuclease YhaM
MFKKFINDVKNKSIDNLTNDLLKKYKDNFYKQQDNLVKEYMLETGLKASEICLCHKMTETGFKIYCEKL